MEIALIFLVVFGAFGWFVYGAYRFIAWNSGHLLPEFHRVTREISFVRYFTRLPALFTTFIGIQNLLLWNLFFFGPPLPDWRAVGVMLVTLLLLLGLVFALALLEWQFWTLTDGVAVTFDPADSSIEVEWLGRQVRLTPETVVRAEVHEGHFDSKLMRGYGYYDLFLPDGQVVRLSEIFFAEHEFMQKHFGNVPLQVFTYRLPWKITADVIRRIDPE